MKVERKRGGFNIHKKATLTENARWRKASEYNADQSDFLVCEGTLLLTAVLSNRDAFRSNAT